MTSHLARTWGRSGDSKQYHGKYRIHISNRHFFPLPNSNSVIELYIFCTSGVAHIDSGISGMEKVEWVQGSEMRNLFIICNFDQSKNPYMKYIRSLFPALLIVLSGCKTPSDFNQVLEDIQENLDFGNISTVEADCRFPQDRKGS